MSWLTWLFRGAERDRAYTRLAALQTAYAAYGDYVIKLSARTDLLRKSAGSTLRSFDFVERSFAAASTRYAEVNSLIEQLEQGLAVGRVGDFPGAEQAVKALEPVFAELDRHLTTWESRWEQVPQVLAQAEQSLAGLRLQAEPVIAALGAALALARRLEALGEHLSKVKAVLLAGNPIEAGHLLDDYAIASGKVATEVGLYVSGTGAIAEVEQRLQRLQSAVNASSPGEAIAGMGAAEALIARLRPALQEGRLDQFGEDLLQIHKHLDGPRGTARH